MGRGADSFLYKWKGSTPAEPEAPGPHPPVPGNAVLVPADIRPGGNLGRGNDCFKRREAQLFPDPPAGPGRPGHQRKGAGNPCRLHGF